MPNAEQERLKNADWKIWGPYLSNRQWGTVREDYSSDGNPWNYLTHDMARSKAYRWGEEGIAGISDNSQILCFAPAFWNGNDTILKERFFGLTPSEGNHGEDVKEYYYYIDNTPTHSYMKMLYKYPQKAFPYNELIQKNKLRGLDKNEYELIDTGIFENNKYFDIEVEYAKQKTCTIISKITVHNRSSEDATIFILPHIWFRNTWSWDGLAPKPKLFSIEDNVVKAEHELLGEYFISFNECQQILFCENETNNQKLYGYDDGIPFPKDGINEHIIHNLQTVNPDNGGTKAAAVYKILVKAGGNHSIWVQLSNEDTQLNQTELENILSERRNEADIFYDSKQDGIPNAEDRFIQRQALAGLLWSKQYYYYNLSQWRTGDKNEPAPPVSRFGGRNSRWMHLYAGDVILMPDKWEYPWFAAWDTAFQAISLSVIDMAMAKEQLLLLTHEWYMHPSGQLPGYEWEFDNVNPPMHAWAAWYIYEQDKIDKQNNGDIIFLKSVFNRLIINFTWWVNREDKAGNNIFEGGFLGLDNIAIIDRSQPLPDGGIIEQSDGTSWMAMYSLKMMRIALELAEYDSVYEDMATKFFEHFMYIAGAMNTIGSTGTGLWDEEDGFFYDQVKFPNGDIIKLKVRSLVGLLPLMCVEVLNDEVLNRFPEFTKRLNWFLKHKPDLSGLVSHWNEQGKSEKHLFSLLRGHRLKELLRKLLDPDEFFSDYGIRSVSKFHLSHPYILYFGNQKLVVEYTPSESKISMFGGNSNWRGPIWIPVNFLIIKSLVKFHSYYGDDFILENPSDSDKIHNLTEIGSILTRRILSIFQFNDEGIRPVDRNYPLLSKDIFFKNNVLFYEYFNGDDGSGAGASHQTGWTALIANLISHPQAKNPI